MISMKSSCLNEWNSFFNNFFVRKRNAVQTLIKACRPNFCITNTIHSNEHYARIPISHLLSAIYSVLAFVSRSKERWERKFNDSRIMTPLLICNRNRELTNRLMPTNSFAVKILIFKICSSMDWSSECRIMENRGWAVLVYPRGNVWHP